jgi:hypothetical protein
MNPGEPKSGGDTPHSVSDIVNMETDELLAVAGGAGFGVRKQVALKSLVRSQVVRPLPIVHSIAV